MKIFAFVFSLLFISTLHAQDNCSLRVSLLTCTPGEELYSTFGHSAIRVTDAQAQTDIIFNYGTFDFEDPDFYEKFIQGKLLYFVSIDSLDYFLAEYKYFNRGVTEQVLDLNCEDRQKLVTALYVNAREENRYYLYDFTHDNCTTRLRDILEKSTGKGLQAKDVRPTTHTTFRHMIHEYLHKGDQYWSKLGIDILLGSPLDRKVTNREAMFLPDYLLKAFDSATLERTALVKEKRILLPAAERKTSSSLFSPLVIFSLLFLLIAWLTYTRRANTFLKAFDVFFFSLLGILGILLLFMWFGTNHVMCRNNYNLLWALPTHLPMALMLFTSKQWVRKYFRVVFYFSLLVMLAWFFLPQQMNSALLAILGIIIVRSYSISNKYPKSA